ncbi:MAG: hypothetical protein KKE44_05760 [Proteobacteria bacterium]|nr:hypothetical protein [Pseudomonadota bacterium]MBU1582235.1 hypothetical protein [Pseudomonadota bacterium]MBU2454391.1 hypothetical protein [Pseudomonadota bacterium]MBU2631168.1 hypothetical protein [Pseudomonadota bacterium]
MAETDEKKELKKLPTKTLSLIIVSFLLVAVFIFAILFPQYNHIQTAKNDRISKALLLEEQKKLFPLYAQAEALAKIEFNPKLPFQEKKALDRDKISTLSNIFSDIAQKNNMELSQNSLDISSLKNQSNSISMDVQFTGDLFDFRNCLISLADLPFFHSFEKIQIKTDQSNIKRFSTKISITIDKK